MARLVGINHVAVQVGDLDAMIEFLGKLVDGLELRGRSGAMAFVDLGDQFIALERVSEPVNAGHYGLVVDDQEEVVRRAREGGARMRTTARRDGGAYVLDGSKRFITNAAVAGLYTVFAKTDPDAGHQGISAFIVEAAVCDRACARRLRGHAERPLPDRRRRARSAPRSPARTPVRAR